MKKRKVKAGPVEGGGTTAPAPPRSVEDEEGPKKVKPIKRKPTPVEALCQIIETVGTSFDFDTVASSVVLELKEVLHFERASMGLIDKTGERMMVYALYMDHPSELDVGRPIPAGDRGFWRAVNEGRPVICNDMEAEEKDVEESAILLKEGIRSYVSVPLVVDGKVEGIVNFGSGQVGHFKEEDLAFLGPAVCLIARALKGSRIEDQLKDSIQKMQLVDRASNMARNINDIDEFTRNVLKEGQEAFGQFNFVLFEVDEGAKVFRIRALRTGFQYSTLEGYSQPLDKGILGKVRSTKSAWVVPDATKQEGFIEAPNTTIRAEIAAPCIVNGRVRGVLSCITPYPFDFKAYEVWVVKQLAEIIAQRLFSDETPMTDDCLTPPL